jgi:hypothetical protein
MITTIILLIGFATAIIGLTFKVQNSQLNRLIKLFHLVFLFLTFVCIILFTQNLSFSGFYSNRIIIAFWVTTGIALFGLYGKGSINLLSKIYYGFFFGKLIINQI